MEISTEQTLFSVLWIALMLIFLLGDVLRIFAGDFTPGEMDGNPVSTTTWLMAALMMLIPIIMVVLNILVPNNYMRWPNIILSGAFLLMNLAGITGYKLYDQVLLGFSFALNIITIYLAFILK